MLNQNSVGRIALFGRAPTKGDDPTLTYPKMTGNIESNHEKWSIGAFEDEEYNNAGVNVQKKIKRLSLKITDPTEVDKRVFVGFFYSQEIEGKANKYYGFISERFVDIVDGAEVKSYSDWQLSFNASIEVYVDDKGRDRRYFAGKVKPAKKVIPSTNKDLGDANEEDFDIPL